MTSYHYYAYVEPRWKTDDPPGPLEDNRGKYVVYDVPLDSIEKFEKCLSGAKFLARGSKEERRAAIEAQSSELLAEAGIHDIETTCVNDSEPNDTVWTSLKDGKFVIHPRRDGVDMGIAVGKSTKGKVDLWEQPCVRVFLDNPPKRVRAARVLDIGPRPSGVPKARSRGARATTRSKKKGAKGKRGGRSR